MLTWNTRPEPTTIVCLSATGIASGPYAYVLDLDGYTIEL